jgi:hypothetical protein
MKFGSAKDLMMAKFKVYLVAARALQSGQCFFSKSNVDGIRQRFHEVSKKINSTWQQLRR